MSNKTCRKWNSLTLTKKEREEQKHHPTSKTSFQRDREEKTHNPTSKV